MPRIHNKEVAKKLAAKQAPPVRLPPMKLPSGGKYGRGQFQSLYDCLDCVDHQHDSCERQSLIFCRCWRTRHHLPPPKGKSRTPQGGTISSKEYFGPVVRHKAPVLEEVDEIDDDDIEWDD